MADRLLKISLVPSRRLVRHDVSYEFMNRQMVWHAFTVCFLSLIPFLHSINSCLGIPLVFASSYQPQDNSPSALSYSFILFPDIILYYAAIQQNIRS
jgi:hypothetical protein